MRKNIFAVFLLAAILEASTASAGLGSHDLAAKTSAGGACAYCHGG